MTDHLPSKEQVSTVEEIRVRAEIPVTAQVANPGEYFRVQQLLRDRRDMLVHCDALRAEVERLRADLQQARTLLGYWLAVASRPKVADLSARTVAFRERTADVAEDKCGTSR